MPDSQGLPIVFIPGMLCDEALFAPQIKVLQASHECIVVPPTFANNILDLADGVIAKAPPRFALAGLSTGGYVAFEILRQLAAVGQRNRIAKIVLMNTSAREDTEDRKNRRRALIALSRTGRFKGVTPRLLPNLINEKHIHDPAITQVIFDMAARIGQSVFEMQQTAILHRPDSRDVLPTITQPTLIIGGADDRLISVEEINEMADAIPGAQAHILEDCGHLSPLEQPEKVTKLLVGFL
ncbi:MAG: alpha/beta fold hydrolase [Bdellovibrionales bacterium]